MATYNDEEGVWRTIGGRRVFIRTGQSLSDAMKESGKFSRVSKNQELYKKLEEEKEPKLSDSQKEAGEKLNKKAQEGVRNDIKDFLSGRENYDGSKEEFINDLSNEWGVDKNDVEDILNEEMEKHPRLFKNDRPSENKKVGYYELENGKKTYKERELGDDERGYWTKENGVRVFKENPNYKGETYPKAQGATKFEDLGLEVSDKKAFSEYLQNKYGTDDFKVINFDNKEGAKKIYDEYASQRENDRVLNYFNEQEKNAYLNKDWSYGYRKETLENMSNKELDEYIKKNEDLVKEYTDNYNKDLQYDQRLKRNKQDTLFDSASKTKYEQQLKNAQDEKARREQEVDKYFKKVENNEKQDEFTSKSTNPFYSDTTYTKEQLNKMAENGVKPMENTYSGSGWKGVNADKNLSTKEQAKAITDAMKQQYPDVKISRKSDLYSGGSSIDFNIMSSDKDLYVSDADIDKINDFDRLSTGYGFENWAEKNVKGFKRYTNEVYTTDDVRKYAKEVLSDLKKRDNQNVRGDEWYLSDYGKKVVSELNKQANSYTYDDSDAMTDYFNHGTYMHISIGKWNKPYEVNQKTTNDIMNEKIRKSKKK